MQQDKPVEIGRFINAADAEFALSVLRGSGIEGYLDQPFTASIAPHYLFGSGGVRLFVRAEDAERAILALQRSEGSTDDRQDEPI